MTARTPMSSATSQRVLGLAAVALLVTGLYGIGFWWFRDRGPARGTLEEAAWTIRDRFQPGDAVFVLPAYATRARTFLGDLGLTAVQAPEKEDLSAYAHVFLLGLFGRGDGARLRLEATGAVHRGRVFERAGTTVDVYAPPVHHPVTTDLVAELRQAEVFHEIDGRTVACAVFEAPVGPKGLGARWRCPEDSEWFYVGAEWHRMGEAPRLCLWAHPPTRGRLHVLYPKVKLTGLISVSGGHTLNGSLHARAPVELLVQVADQSHLISFEVSDTNKTVMVGTSSVGVASVEFSISSPDAAVNHFCFRPEVRAP